MKRKPPSGTINSRYEKSPQSTGGKALVTERKTSRDDTQQYSGTIYSRHLATKPSVSSGDLGRSQPIAVNDGYKENKGGDAPLGPNVHKRSKPKR